MTRAAQLPRLDSPSLQRHSLAVKANLDALERKADSLEERVALLESRDAWFRATFYPYIQGLAAAMPYAAPPALPE